MHERQTIAMDDPGRLSVCLSVTRFRCVNTAKGIEVLLEWRHLGTKAQCVKQVS